MASYEVGEDGEDGEDNAATAQIRNLLYADGVIDLLSFHYCAEKLCCSLLLSFVMRLPFVGKSLYSSIS